VRQKICDLKDLAELSCREFSVKNDVLTQDAFLIYFKHHCYAYENSCPHTGVSLNWQKEQFFSLDGFFCNAVCTAHYLGQIVESVFRGPVRVCVYNPSVYLLRMMLFTLLNNTNYF